MSRARVSKSSASAGSTSGGSVASWAKRRTRSCRVRLRRRGESSAPRVDSELGTAGVLTSRVRECKVPGVAHPPMSTWSIFPEAGPPHVLFSTPHGPVTRADIEQQARQRSSELDGEVPEGLSPQAYDPPALLADLLAIWARRFAVVLEPGGRRIRRDPTTRLGSRPFSGLGLRLDADQRLLELYTSGTTGKPECHTKTARQLLGEASILGPLLGLGPNSVVLSTVPLHHLYGLLFGLLAPLGAGARIVSDRAADPGQFHPHRLALAVREHGVTHLVTIPAHIRSLLDAEVPLIGLREVVSSAAALPSEWAKGLEELSGARVLDVLGSTESGGIAYRRSACEAGYRPLPGVTVRASADGHLEVHSPFLFEAAALTTGDRVSLAPDGTFLHLGRDDGVVKVGGKRVSLWDLEASALRIPGVSDAFAFARPTASTRGTEIWLVVAAEGLERRTLRAELGHRVDPLLVPRRVCVLPRLPRDARGKLPRALLERYVLLPGFDLLGVTLSPFRLELRLRDDSKRLQGHFPTEKVLPAVAQLLDLVVPEVERMAGAPVVEARRLKWQAPVLPGDAIVLTIEALGQDRESYRFRFVDKDGDVVSSGLLRVTSRVSEAAADADGLAGDVGGLVAH